jgi:hypothetical protein
VADSLKQEQPSLGYDRGPFTAPRSRENVRGAVNDKGRCSHTPECGPPVPIAERCCHESVHAHDFVATGFRRAGAKVPLTPSLLVPTSR